MGSKALCEKSPDALGRSRHIGDQRSGRRSPRALVIGEEEGPILDQRSSQSAAELVALIRRGLSDGAKKLVPSSAAVAEEFVSGAMELVAAGAHDHADLPARISPKVVS